MQGESIQEMASGSWQFTICVTGFFEKEASKAVSSHTLFKALILKQRVMSNIVGLTRAYISYSAW